MELAGKNFLVIGLARTGCACARFLARRGAGVLVNDRRPAAELADEIGSLRDLAIRYRLGAEELAWLNDIDCVVPSPGVAPENRLLREACARGIPVWSEIELAYRFFGAPIIAVTGTNGKSTTTSLIGAMLEAAGRRVFTGGNLGAPFIGAAGQNWDWGVLEISSFQLEWTDIFRPRIAVLLNVTEDHLDRYPSFAAYRAAKERIFKAQTVEDTAILNRDEPAVWQMHERIAARVVSFGVSPAAAGVSARPDEIVWRDGESNEERYSLARVKLQGVHNVENMMAAVAATKAAGLENSIIQRTLENFPGLEHRLEFVREKNRVRYFNDSKGTNVGAVVKSLASFDGPVILLAGGVDKGGDYAPLAEAVRRKVRRLVLFGTAKEIIAGALGSQTETILVDDLEAALRDAAAHAQSGDVVLLSPACSSFDQFRNYAERGKFFKRLVQQL
ncbi:MAG TPA: UDP-N-acetylmuramoyl-L-alanine--D-glutamate ligase [Candidatus Binatia bacterium]|nr:UDP-N-acetylmuramoyl-L-alanine--D-glutamate ligase [Candidatus Binatia bacterium]